jgi:hypothetical protein
VGRRTCRKARDALYRQEAIRVLRGRPHAPYSLQPRAADAFRDTHVTMATYMYSLRAEILSKISPTANPFFIWVFP